MTEREADIPWVVGIFSDIPEEEYHNSPGISQSQLKLLGEEGGPAKFRYGFRRETRPQKLGTLAHSVILQPNTVLERYHVTRLPREGTKAWAEEEAAYPGRTMVKQSDFDKAMRMADAVFRWSSVARELLTSGDRVAVEQSFYWTDEESGLLMRGRGDAAHEDFHVLLDVKSAHDASKDGFRDACRRYWYSVQAAHYLGGWPLAGGWSPTDFVFIVIETAEPYLTATYALGQAALDAGRSEIRRLVGIYQQCEASGSWPGYQDGIQNLEL